MMVRGNFRLYISLVWHHQRFGLRKDGGISLQSWTKGTYFMKIISKMGFTLAIGVICLSACKDKTETQELGSFGDLAYFESLRTEITYRKRLNKPISRFLRICSRRRLTLTMETFLLMKRAERPFYLTSTWRSWNCLLYTSDAADE